ncbi:hypothetical protein K420107F6_27230 [Lactonifactor longoviformis]
MKGGKRIAANIIRAHLTNTINYSTISSVVYSVIYSSIYYSLCEVKGDFNYESTKQKNGTSGKCANTEGSAGVGASHHDWYAD